MSKIEIIYNSFNKVEYFLEKIVIDQKKWKDLLIWLKKYIDWLALKGDLHNIMNFKPLFLELKEANWKNLTKRELKIYELFQERKKILEKQGWPNKKYQTICKIKPQKKLW